MWRQLALALALAVSGAAAAGGAMAPPRVRTNVDKRLGPVLARADRQAIYVWNREPKGAIRCTGACAAAWPPVLVRAGAAVPRHVKGIAGTFGTIRRPNGARQLTLDRRALYTYAHERPSQVLCDDVDGWFAVKLRRAPVSTP
jgi:predicted lipoprotein with Yx(FWY)xxD motif